MDRIERIIERCPRFYKSWEKDSILSIFIHAASDELDTAEEGVTSLMRSHWIETAQGANLDRLSRLMGAKRAPDESDRHFKAYLKKIVDEYRGGGALSVIKKEIGELIKSDQVQVIENPIVDSYAEFAVIANDSWILGSNSIQNEEATLSLSVEGDGEVSKPRITNVDTGQSILFRGRLTGGNSLVITKEAALLGDKEVTKDVYPRELPQLTRKGSTWKYSEELLERIGVFDEGKFDEHTFAVGVPTVKVRFDWQRHQPATFVVEVPRKALLKSQIPASRVEALLNYLKAAGINGIVRVTE